MSLVASLLCAVVLAVSCQGRPSSSTPFRHERSLDIALPRRLVIPSIIDYHYDHTRLNTITDRVRRDVPPSSYKPIAPASYPVPASEPIYPPLPSIPVQDYPIPLPPQQETNDYNGNFSYNYEDDNGTNVQVRGYQKTLDNGEVVQAMEGQYSYTAPDGTLITTKWFADETGFHAKGAHIPGSEK